MPMRSALRLALTTVVLAAAAGPWQARGAAEDLRAPGERIYFGTHPSLAAPGAAQVDGAPIPPAAAACAGCHRRSGLGSAESTVLVPPVAGALLFNALSPQTGRRLPWPSRDRTRPAYDEATLLRALNEGVAPDGVALQAPMPRYRLAPQEVAALAAYLRTLSVDTAPGVSDTEVVFATVTTPDAPAADVDDLLRTLQAFVADKNAGTRHETRRREQAVRKEETMYRRYRRWRVEHWALTGEPETWRAQLEARYRTMPVFALLSGLSYDTWSPVHAFCKAERVPCLLPNAWLPPDDEDFYSIYFSPGLRGEARALAGQLEGVREVVLWAAAGSTGARQREIVSAALAARGIASVQRAPGAADIVVSTVARHELAQRFAALDARPARVYVLAGALGGTQAALPPDDAALRARAVLVTPLAPETQAERQMARARAWMARRGLRPGNEQVAINALAAGLVAVETLMHVDERFSREYCIEKIEHNLENVPPLTAYPRLAIGPSRRFASMRVTLLSPVTRDDAIAGAPPTPMIEPRP